MDWVEISDVISAVLLAIAFASVVRLSHAQHLARIWMTGWCIVCVHEAASLFLLSPGLSGSLAVAVACFSLVWAALLFLFASFPFFSSPSSLLLTAATFLSISLYTGVLFFFPAGGWRLSPAAALVGLAPLVVVLRTPKEQRTRFYWFVAVLSVLLSISLLLLEPIAGQGDNLAMHAIFFFLYAGCGLHFWLNFGRKTIGSHLAALSFLGWATVYLSSPLLRISSPQFEINHHIYNLPMYLVAVGMMLFLLEEQIAHNQHLALHDDLTGLPNRRLFRDRLEGALSRARRNGANVALLMVDLNGFKQINDLRGHTVGDRVLQQVGARLMARVRKSDTVARTGGDEFCVLLEAASREEAVRVSRELHLLLSAPIQLPTEVIPVSASIGIALFPDDASEAENLYATADRIMYKIKHARRVPEPQLDSVSDSGCATL